jgi:hypothetical protein
MGIGKLIEEVGGAIAAEQAAEAADPNANMLVKGAAAIAGFVAADKLSGALEAHADAKREESQTAAQAADQSADQDSSQDASDDNSDDAGPEPK